MASQLDSGSISAFLRWWGGRLAELAPKRWTEESGAASRILLELNGGEMVFSLCRAGERQELGRLSPPPVDLADEQALLTVLRPHLKRNARLLLRLPANQVVRRQVVLPAAARENLRQVLSFEMDRQTPFRAEQVYFDFRSGAGGRRDGVAVELVATPRQALDPLLERLERLGMVPWSVDVIDPDRDPCEGTVFNLLPLAQRQPPRLLMTPFNLALLAVAALLAIGIAVVPLVQMHQAVARLAEQVAAARADAEKVVTLREQLQARFADAARILERKRATPSAVEVIAELARLLPDSTWLRTLDIAGDSVRINGESAASSELIGRIEESPLFKAVSFASPVTQNPASGGERFQIDAHIEHKSG